MMSDLHYICSTHCSVHLFSCSTTFTPPLLLKCLNSGLELSVWGVSALHALYKKDTESYQVSRLPWSMGHG